MKVISALLLAFAATVFAQDTAVDTDADLCNVPTCCERPPNCCYCGGFVGFVDNFITNPVKCVAKRGIWNPFFCGGSGGDPHFKMWDNSKFDYHGECDLVLIKNPDFAEGKGLDFHIRTTRKGTWSYIESAGVKIGEDILEVTSKGDYYKNGVAIAKDIVKTPFADNFVAHIDEDGKRETIQINLGGENEYINFEPHSHDMLYMAPQGYSFDGSLGMLGKWGTGEKIGRDGVTVFEDIDEFAREWQVRDTEPMLFRESRFPQYPQQCLAPEGSFMRLGSSLIKAAAEEACAWWGEDQENCVFDVMATRNLKIADKTGAAVV